MVRTRNMRDTAEEPVSYRGRPRSENRFRHVPEDEDDSADSNFEPILRRRIKRKYIPVKISESAMAHDSFSDGIGKITRSSKRESLQMQIDEDDLDASKESMASRESMASKDDAGSGGIRRSTRQRKCMYDTLNQGWLLGSARLRDYSSLVDDVVDGRRLTKEKKNGAGEDDSEPVFEDMYSRIKRERRSSVQKYYGLRCSKRQKLRDGSEGETESEDAEQGTGETGDSLEETTCSDDDSTPTTLRHKTYYLRQKRPIIDRFQVSVEPTKQRNTSKSVFHVSPPRRRILRRADLASMSFRSPSGGTSTGHHLHSPLMRRRRHATHNSSTSSSASSSSSSGDDERRFEKRKTKSMNKARNRLLPMNFEKEDLNPDNTARSKVGCSLADVDPMNIDRQVSFDRVGGLGTHIQALKEMLLLPLMYPEVFERFRITPPQGVLFYGPPGTGKTLVARALANECSQGERKVAFFMRKGADCLSKWVGESERQLRLLFDQAYTMRPSIIFFDEIDGLAPVRSSRQDQIHSSIVSTLLALMDGLDSRGEVIVIGATNRVDAIDPALRRPGRFDREFHFPLPTCRDRQDILAIHTRDWIPRLPATVVEELAGRTVGFCGADIKAMCAEAAFLALRRQYPEIYQSKQKLLLDVSTIKIETKDFLKAISGIVPASQRSTAISGRPLSSVVQTLLKDTLTRVLQLLKASFPQGFVTRKGDEQSDRPAIAAITNGVVEKDPAVGSIVDAPGCVPPSVGEAGSSTPPPATAAAGELETKASRPKSASQSWCSTCCQNVCTCPSVDDRYVKSHRPRLLLAGCQGQGQSSHVAPAILHRMERFAVHRLDLPALYAVSAKSPEESCAQIFMDARRVLPSILYLPHVDQWWDTLSDTVRATFLTLLRDVEPTAPLLLLATSDCPFRELPERVKELFVDHQDEVFTMCNPTADERRQFFFDLIQEETRRPPERTRNTMRRRRKLPLAPPPKPRVLSEPELRRVEDEEESTLRELRMFLREILCKLARNRHFSFFTKPVDTGEVSDYLTVIEQPMDLETMMGKIDLHKYGTVENFLADIELICQNALQYNPDREPSDKLIRHRACALRDSAHSLITAQLDPDFEKTCQEIRIARAQRGSSPSKFAPKNYVTMGGLGKQRSADKAKTLVNGTATPSPLGEPQSPTTRCSRRLRGLDVSAESSELQGKTLEGSSSPSAASTSPVQHGYRRRSGLWKYGCIKRRTAKPSTKVVVSTSGDEADDVQIEVGAGGGVTLVTKLEERSVSSLDGATGIEHRLVNGHVPSLEETDIAAVASSSMGLRSRTRRGSSHSSSHSSNGGTSTVVKQLNFCNVGTRLRSTSQLGMATSASVSRVTADVGRRPASAAARLAIPSGCVGGKSLTKVVIEAKEEEEKELEAKEEIAMVVVSPDEVRGAGAAMAEEVAVEMDVENRQLSSASSVESSLTLPSLPEECESKHGSNADAISEDHDDCHVKVEATSQGSPLAIDVELISEEEAEEEEEETRQVIVDPDRLNDLLAAIVDKMTDCVVESLERLHCRLLQRICAHRQDWDRTALVKELEEEVDKFQPRPVNLQF